MARTHTRTALADAANDPVRRPFEQDIAMLESESDCDVAAADKNRA